MSDFYFERLLSVQDYVGGLSVDNKKDFFHIGKMTETFREKVPLEVGIDDQAFKEWSMRFTLAIAQQLAVISGTLTRLIEAVERSEKKP